MPIIWPGLCRDLDNMHKVVLEVPGQPDLVKLHEKLQENDIRKSEKCSLFLFLSINNARKYYYESKL